MQESQLLSAKISLYSPSMAKVTFIQGTTRTEVQATNGDSLLNIALDAGIPMEHACGGNGFCTTCMCTVKHGKESLSARNDQEENMGIIEDPYRLGCQARVEGNDGDVEVEISE
jgi:2Fe-2S ferredoxin